MICIVITTFPALSVALLKFLVYVIPSLSCVEVTQRSKLVLHDDPLSSLLITRNVLLTFFFPILLQISTGDLLVVFNRLDCRDQYDR